MYIAIPHELYDAYNDGEITDSMFEVMVWLHYRANWETGRAKKVCAENIHWQTNRRFSVRTYQDALKNLTDSGWITLHRTPGTKGTYWVSIHNYVALIGAQKEQVLNPRKVTPYCNAEPSQWFDLCADGTVMAAAPVRGECVEGATVLETQNLAEIADPTEPADQKPKVRKSVSEAPPQVSQGGRQETPEETNGAEDDLVLGHADGQQDYDLLAQDHHPDYMVARPVARSIDADEYSNALGLYMDCFQLHPTDMQKPCHSRESVLPFLECALEMQSRCPLKPYKYVCHVTGKMHAGVEPDIGDRHPIRDLVYWNRTHKTGGMAWSCGRDLVNAYWSDSAKSALAQFQSHDAETCVKCRMSGKQKAEVAAT